MHLLVWGHGFIKRMLVQPPGLYHQPADTVTVYGAAEFFLGYRKTSLHGRAPDSYRDIGAGQKNVNEPYGKNRKRFPGEEKRMNMLLSLEPLIYSESITNGEKI